ncbi:hypothetical protein BB560_000017 [Smittium megazygosporum]|uniref:Uncharacterized protein n=1 Tax=Smittium megazygosporum TaxID=133381 RepID=A0A2T9ZLK8_9FUNG|nr:hypothetical protein BB560_000017 [Smittium megazygosporum]
MVSSINNNPVLFNFVYEQKRPIIEQAIKIILLDERHSLNQGLILCPPNGEKVLETC